MIYINHQKKVIFIHIPKTGGSYIGSTLVKYYGFKSYVDILKRRLDHDEICQTNKFKKVLTNNPLYDNTFFNKLVGIFVYCKTSDYFNSLLNMDEEKWKTYTKFCFIRNPYDRVLSGWRHIEKVFKRGITFNQYIMQDKYNVSDIEYGHVFMSQKTQIQNIDGNCGVDIIGRFEHLEHDFVLILKHLGFEKIVHTPKKINSSKNFADRNNINLSISEIRVLNILFEDDFNLFHYKKLKI
jgi:hypothetical protein